jgi:hypothetical protein
MVWSKAASSRPSRTPLKTSNISRWLKLTGATMSGGGAGLSDAAVADRLVKTVLQAGDAAPDGQNGAAEGCKISADPRQIAMRRCGLVALSRLGTDAKIAAMAAVLYTIGHSTHPFERLLERLTRHGITALADVRSFPRSRFNPQFNRERLDAALHDAGMRYVFLGDQLGGKPGGPDARDYQAIAGSAEFQAGLDRVRAGAERHVIALMCAEQDPLDCHRFVLICRHLRHDLAIRHILPDGAIEQQGETEARLIAATQLTADRTGALLQESPADMLELAYDRRGRSMNRPRKTRR